MSQKNYVLDTNVLLHDPDAMYGFEDNHVIIPIYVIEEIDTFKKDLSELGRNARQIARLLDSLRKNGGLAHPVALESGGTIRVELGSRSALEHRNVKDMDQYILELAIEVRDAEPERKTTLVTKDVNMRIRGDALGLATVDYDPENVAVEELYPGSRDLLVAPEQIDEFYKEGGVRVDAELVANEYVLMRDGEQGGRSALGRYDVQREQVVGIRNIREGVWGIRPRNKEQHYALDLLLDESVRLVTLVGKAGTGKTLLALAAGLHLTSEVSIFQKLLVSRPVFPLGRDIGYLPGDISEKLTPWMQPIYDNLELLMGLSPSDKQQGRGYEELLHLGLLEIEPLTYIRGRSLPNAYMIVDEAQNLTPHEVKTIITRAGDGTKIILTGDPYQIDNPYIDSSNNGLTTVAERFKGQEIAGHVTLTRGERSALAELATQIL